MIPNNPVAFYAPRIESPLPELKTAFRAFQTEALLRLTQCQSRSQAVELNSMIKEVAKIVKKTCNELQDHPAVEKEELNSFATAAERTLSIYRGKITVYLGAVGAA